MTVEDLVKKGWTKPEHLVYVVEELRRSEDSYAVKKDLVTAWSHRAGLRLEPWMVAERKLAFAGGEV